MKFQFPELKFPNTLLTIWWGAAMMALLAMFWFPPNPNPCFSPCAMTQLSGRYLIFAIVASYFIAVQIYILRLAIREQATPSPIIEKWHKVMVKAQFMHLSLVPLLLLLPMIYYQSSVDKLNHDLIEMIIAPGTYSHSVSFRELYTLASKIGYFAFGTAIAYLHVRLLAAWLSLAGLAFRPVDIAKILVIILGIVVLLDYSTSTFIEPVIIEGWGRSCEGRGVGSPNFTETCQPFWIYRNINRIVESLEYSLYGTFTGGIQFINIFKAPLIGYWYDGVTSINLGELKQIQINLELVRNLIMGILSPSIQLFFIMRYLKKRSFEKAKREYAT